MSLQVIKSIEGKAEYVLLPMEVYQAMKHQIDKALDDDDYIPFKVENYIDNPVAIARINACLTQEELAERMEVSQAYISKLESQEAVSAKVIAKVMAAISKD